MGWFGSSKNEVWQELCTQIGADFISGGFWGGDRVQAHVGQWTITLDTFTVSDGETSHTCTRMRAPFVNPTEFRFTIYRKGILTGLARWLGLQDIEVGDPEFDQEFVVKSND